MKWTIFILSEIDKRTTDLKIPSKAWKTPAKNVAVKAN